MRRPKSAKTILANVYLRVFRTKCIHVAFGNNNKKTMPNLSKQLCPYNILADSSSAI